MGEIIPTIFEHLFKAIRKETGINKEQIRSGSRLRDICEARHLFTVISRKLSKHTYTEIGIALGNKNHATIWHGHRAMNDLLDINKKLRMRRDAILRFMPKNILEPLSRCEHCNQILNTHEDEKRVTRTPSF